MQILRTSDDCFNDIPDYPFTSHYIDQLPDIEDCRIHYLDEGDTDSEVTWLCLHGQPTWSYLYRKMIPAFVKAGHRVVAPDLIGFGRSDKPDDESFYTFNMHRDMLIALIDRLDLRNIRLICQDWGGILGLTLPMVMADRFAGLLLLNTTLCTGDAPLSDGFLNWREYVRRTPDFVISGLMQRSTPHLNEKEAAIYDAPFPDHTYRAGVRRFPELVAENPDAPGADISRQARAWLKNEWQGDSLMIIGMQDPVLGQPVMRELHGSIRNCPPPVELPDHGHFIQEWGEDIAHRAIQALT